MERDLRWKTLQSEYLYRKDWLNIRVDTCEKPDGKIVSPYYVYEFTDWVCAFAITKIRKLFSKGNTVMRYSIPDWNYRGDVWMLRIRIKLLQLPANF